MKKELNELKEFFSKYKTALLILLISSFIIYGFKLFNYSISIDTERIILDSKALIDSWYSIGRYSLGFLKFILGLSPFNYYVANLIMIIIFPISVFIMCYLISCLNKKGNLSNLKIILFSLLVLTSPIFCEQFNFTLQCAEVAISFLILDVGLFFLIFSINNNKKWPLLISIISFIECLGCYQSFAELIAFGVFLILFYVHNEKNKEICKCTYINIFIVLAGCIVGYLAVSKVVCFILEIGHSEYLTSQILWLNKPILSVIRSILASIKRVILGEGLFYTLGFLVACGISIWYSIKNFKNNKFSSIYNFFILLCPFLLLLLLGTMQAYRAQFAYPFVMAYFIVFVFNYDYKICFKYIMLFVAVLISFRQFRITESLFMSDYLNYEYEKVLVNQIINSIEYDKLEDKTLIFIGSKNSNIGLKGETIGYTFFEWDNSYIIGSNGRIQSLFGILNYNYKLPTVDEYNTALEKASDMNVYPSEGSIIYYDNIIVIKLS